MILLAVGQPIGWFLLVFFFFFKILRLFHHEALPQKAESASN
jgi:hypothetical protein